MYGKRHPDVASSYGSIGVLHDRLGEYDQAVAALGEARAIWQEVYGSRHPDVALGASPRASLYLLRCARARALLDGRHYFTHADVQAVAPAVLGHRLIVRPEAEVEGRRPLDVIRELLSTVPVLESAPRRP